MFDWPPPYHIKRHQRARHVKLRAVATQGLVITVPMRFNIREIPTILQDNQAWIMRHLAALPRQENIILPDKIDLPACNESWSVKQLCTASQVRLYTRHSYREILLEGKLDGCKIAGKLLRDWVVKRAKATLPNWLAQLSVETQLAYTKVSVRCQKTLWGSCTHANAIQLNYKLLYLPLSLVRHVMIHELCHTIHHNHSNRFWAHVARYDQDWKMHARALRQAEQYVPSWDMGI